MIEEDDEEEEEEEEYRNVCSSCIVFCFFTSLLITGRFMCLGDSNVYNQHTIIV